MQGCSGLPEEGNNQPDTQAGCDATRQKRKAGLEHGVQGLGKADHGRRKPCAVQAAFSSGGRAGHGGLQCAQDRGRSV